MIPGAIKKKSDIMRNESEKQIQKIGNIGIKFRKMKSTQKSIFYEGVKMYIL